MRTLVISLNLLCLLLAACTTTTRLPTDTDEIDISGRWNATDSEIASQELMNKIINSIWCSTLKQEEGSFTNIIVKNITENGELSPTNNSKSIQEALEAQVQQQQYWRSLKEGEIAYSADYYLEPALSKSESVSKKETVYLYTLTIKIIDREQQLVYQAQETVKKYIKN